MLALRIGSRFAVEAVRHVLPIVSVDVSADRSVVAVIDTTSRLSAFDFFAASKSE